MIHHQKCTINEYCQLFSLTLGSMTSESLGTFYQSPVWHQQPRVRERLVTSFGKYNKRRSHLSALVCWCYYLCLWPPSFLQKSKGLRPSFSLSELTRGNRMLRWTKGLVGIKQGVTWLLWTAPCRHLGKPLSRILHVQTEFCRIAFQPPPPPPQANGRFVAGIFRRKLANSLKQRFWLWEWTFWQ